jgi:hypothetical protein
MAVLLEQFLPLRLVASWKAFEVWEQETENRGRKEGQKVGQK